MSKLFVAGFFAWLVIPAAAQTVQPPAANPLSTWLRGAYMNNRNTILRTAERMPEENYGMRPGPQEEVRTFGQQVGTWPTITTCGVRKPRAKNPTAAPILAADQSELIKAVTDAFTYCEGVYNVLTDASGTEMIDITQESGRQTESPHGAADRELRPQQRDLRKHGQLSGG
jgi:hypothetical protein